MVGKDAGACVALVGAGKQFDQIMAVKDVVPQDQGTGVVADKVFANDEGLGQSIGAGLHRILNVHAPLAAIAQ